MPRRPPYELSACFLPLALIIFLLGLKPAMDFF